MISVLLIIALIDRFFPFDCNILPIFIDNLCTSFIPFKWYIKLDNTILHNIFRILPITFLKLTSDLNKFKYFKLFVQYEYLILYLIISIIPYFEYKTGPNPKS